MSYSADKLSQLSQKKQALIDEEIRLVEKRKKEIGHLAERLNLLTTSDELLSGLFLELQSALKEKSEHIQHWENIGAEFLKPKKLHSKGTETCTSGTVQN